MIVVAGEALIDLILHPDLRLTAVAGGGPFNTARTIGRLGGDVAFLGRLSTDRFGALLRDALGADGVDLTFATVTEAPTTLAVAELDAAGAATYRFHTAETSAPGLSSTTFSRLFAEVPTRSTSARSASCSNRWPPRSRPGSPGSPTDTLLMVDPNCRPRVIADRDAYLARLAASSAAATS